MLDPITIKGATFVKVDWESVLRGRRFIIQKDAVETAVRLEGNGRDRTEEMHKEMEFIATLEAGEEVDVVIKPYPWRVAGKSGTIYYMKSISRSL